MTLKTIASGMFVVMAASSGSSVYAESLQYSAFGSNPVPASATTSVKTTVPNPSQVMAAKKAHDSIISYFAYQISTIKTKKPDSVSDLTLLSASLTKKVDEAYAKFENTTPGYGVREYAKEIRGIKESFDRTFMAIIAVSPESVSAANAAALSLQRAAVAMATTKWMALSVPTSGTGSMTGKIDANGQSATVEIPSYSYASIPKDAKTTSSASIKISANMGQGMESVALDANSVSAAGKTYFKISNLKVEGQNAKALLAQAGTDVNSFLGKWFYIENKDEHLARPSPATVGIILSTSSLFKPIYEINKTTWLVTLDKDVLSKITGLSIVEAADVAKSFQKGNVILSDEGNGVTKLYIPAETDGKTATGGLSIVSDNGKISAVADVRGVGKYAGNLFTVNIDDKVISMNMDDKTTSSKASLTYDYSNLNVDFSTQGTVFKLNGKLDIKSKAADLKATLNGQDFGTFTATTGTDKTTDWKFTIMSTGASANFSGKERWMDAPSSIEIPTNAVELTTLMNSLNKTPTVKPVPVQTKAGNR